MPNYEEISVSKVGASFKVKGKLALPDGGKEKFELKVFSPEEHSCKVIGQCDASKYPMSKKGHNVEFLREHAHLRPRTKLISGVARVRNSLAFATHKFFQERGFLYIHTPIITASDCEGAGEMFQVSTILPDPSKPISSMELLEKVGQENEEEKKEEEVKPLSKKQQKKQAKKKGGSEPAEETKAPVEEQPAQIIPLEERKVNYKKDFFGRPAFLTVSGQLSVENYASGCGDCYTFGPTFRAENSHTSRHLAEFWMIEPEIVFASLSDVMDLTEDYVKYCLRYVMINNADDIDFFN